MFYKWFKFAVHLKNLCLHLWCAIVKVDYPKITKLSNLVYLQESFIWRKYFYLWKESFHEGCTFFHDFIPNIDNKLYYKK